MLIKEIVKEKIKPIKNKNYYKDHNKNTCEAGSLCAGYQLV